MKRTQILAAAVALGLAFAASAASAQGPYAGAHYFNWEAQATDSPKARANARRVLAGYMFNDYVGLEVHAAKGGTDHLGNGVRAELDQLVAGFARINLPMANNWANLFGLVGYADGEIEVRGDNVTGASISEGSFALGAGLEIAIVPDFLYVSADYVDYISKTGRGGSDYVEASAASLGLRVEF